ncbi:MAG: HlyC/CorC family transporter [Clostridia bacterium]|nr:HlyC/CorC family transporter [Clostridia bacterium]
MTEYIPYFIVMAVCLVLSAYFSATETAFSSVNKTRLKALSEKGNKKADVVLALTEQYDKLISTILIGNNVVNILLSSMATIVFVKLIQDQDVAATVSTVAVTIVVLIFGEITPKTLARSFAEKFAMATVRLLKFFLILLTPFNFIFSLWRKLIYVLFKAEEEEGVSQEELLILVEEGQQEGSINDDEGELLKNAIEFTDRCAEEILTHRINIEALPITATKQEIADCFTETRFSRLLLFEDSIDNIVGVIHQKDFYVNGGMYKGDIKDISSEPIFINQTEKIMSILKRLQEEKSHIAVVLDEYGGTLGIVTMEDILEELVGEIWDEHDEVVEDYREIGERLYLVEGGVNMEDFKSRFDLDDFETDSVSLGGFVAERLEKVAEEGDRLETDFGVLTVEVCESHRVTSVRVELFEKNEDDEDDKKKSKDSDEDGKEE